MSVIIECAFKHETDNAVLIEIDGEDVWIPFSQVESMHRDGMNVGTIVVSDWIARQKGL